MRNRDYLEVVKSCLFYERDWSRKLLCRLLRLYRHRTDGRRA